MTGNVGNPTTGNVGNPTAGNVGNLKTRVRFAPSPTGFLHVGGARTALFNWLFARHFKGSFILRIEDTDEVRSTEESVGGILEALHWLGLNWDEGPDYASYLGSSAGDRKILSQGNFGPYFQMQRVEYYYQKHVKLLLDQGKAYWCWCTPEELEAQRRNAQLEKRPPRYDGRCREIPEAAARQKKAQGVKPVVRFKMPGEGGTVVEDLIREKVSFENKLLQDFVIQKASGIPTYNFACVVDDHFMEITHVIRGEEHLSNTPGQIQLYQAFGWKPPEFAHLSMILGPDGAKLSKRHGATSVQEYREQGYLAEALRNYLSLLGWSTPDSQQLFEEDELARKFSLEGCQKNPATFDPQKLLWMNGEYIRKLSPVDLAQRAVPFLRGDLFQDKPGVATSEVERVIALEQEKYKLLSDVPRLVEFFFRDLRPQDYDPQAVEKVLKADGALEVLRKLSAVLSKLEPFAEKGLEEAIRAFCGEEGLKTGQVFHPVRVAVSGRTQGPSLFAMLEVLGREKVLKRLKTAESL